MSGADFSKCAGCKDEMCVEIAQCITAAYLEAFKEEERYIKSGVCSDCGATSPAEAVDKCRPRPLGCTGDYTCAGEKLWQEEEREQ